MGELAKQQHVFQGINRNREETRTRFPVGPAQLSLFLAAYFFLVDANIQFALFLTVIAILVFEWEMKPPKGN